MTDQPKEHCEHEKCCKSYWGDPDHEGVSIPCEFTICPHCMDTRSRQHPAPDKALIFVPMSSTELLVIADKEWTNREERKHQHDKTSWISGWLDGYFSKPVTIEQHDAAISVEARREVLEELKCGRKAITLCGSVKFWDEYTYWNAQLTLEGNIVFSCGLSLKEGYEDQICDLPLDDVKRDLDAIHLCKINLSDEIFVLNVGGYIGDSTKREIEYAISKGKRIKYLESLREGAGK